MKATILIIALALLSLPAGAAPAPLPRGAEFQVNGRQAHPSRPSVAAFPDGSFVVGWTSDTSSVLVRFFDGQGRPTSGDIFLDVGDLAGTILDQVVADRDGSFLVVVTGYAHDRHRPEIFLRRFNRKGRPVGTLFRANAPTRSNLDFGVAAIGQDGRIAVAWRATVQPDAAYSHAMARIFSAKGRPLTKEIFLKQGRITGPGEYDKIGTMPHSVAFAPDGTLSALVQEYGPDCFRGYLVRRTPGGSLTRQRLSPSCAFASSSLAMGRDGSLVAAWSQGDTLARRFSRHGTPRGEAFSLSEESSANQQDPAVALQAGGSFVVVWIEPTRLDGEEHEVFGRAFAPDGTPRTGDFLVNTTTEGARFDTAIAAARNGNVLVVWLQRIGLETNVFARLLSASP